MNLTVEQDTVSANKSALFPDYAVQQGVLNLYGPGRVVSQRWVRASVEFSSIYANAGTTVNIYTPIGGDIRNNGAVWNLMTAGAFDTVTINGTAWLSYFEGDGPETTLVNANVSGAVGATTIRNTPLHINALGGINQNTQLTFIHSNGNTSQPANRTLFVNNGGSINGGQVTLKNDTILTLDNGGRIIDGTQTFTDTSTLTAFRPGTITGGTQLFNTGTTLNAGNGVITGGQQIFNSGSILTLAGGAFAGGVQTFIDYTLAADTTNFLTGGTQLLTGTSSLIVGATDAINGSNIALQDTATLDMNGFDIRVGSLGGTGGTVTAGAGNRVLTLGQASGESNFGGTLVPGSATNFRLVKQGNSTQMLSGAGSAVTDVKVSGGTLVIADNPFSAENYTTEAGATTQVGAGSGTLNVSNEMVQEFGSTLDMILDGDHTTPIITADKVTLSGMMNFSGFGEGTPIKSSVVLQQDYLVIRANTLVDNVITNSSLDYLLNDPLVVGGTLTMGFRQAWNQGGDLEGTGNFTLPANTAFDVDVVLGNQTPTTAFVSGWDGKSLVKAGDGLLILSAQNTYTGDTTVNGGTLRTDIANTLDSSAQVRVNDGVLDLNQNEQQIKRLSGAGGTIQLNGAELTLDNPTISDMTIFAGDITDGDNPGGSLVKTGAGSLVLGGQTTWTGDTRIDQGKLVLDGSKGGAQLTGNIIGTSGAVLSLQNGAKLTGGIDPLDVIIDARSSWVVMSDSVIDSLELSGTVSLSDDSGTFNTLTVGGDYMGNDGMLVFNGQLNGDDSLIDKLIVEGNTAGTTLVRVNNIGGSGALTRDGLQLIRVSGQSNGEFIQQGRIVAGAYDYILQRGTTTGNQDQGNWYLSSERGTVRPEAESYSVGLATGNTLFITGLADRAGERSYVSPVTGQKETTSMWIRNEGGWNRSHDSTGQLTTKDSRYVLQIGGNLVEGLNGWDLGMMTGYAQSHSKTRSKITDYRSENKITGYNIGVYATWYANKAEQVGPYVDTVLQYSWFNNKVEGQDITPEKYKSRGFTGSVGSGYTFKVNETANAGYFIQPNARLIWMGVKADDQVESNGTKVSINGDGNLQTQLGVQAFMRINTGEMQVFQPFVEVNWLHNTRDFSTTLDDVTIRQAGDRNFAQFTLGAEGQVNEKLSLRGNLAYQMGSHSYQDSSIMLGARYSF